MSVAVDTITERELKTPMRELVAHLEAWDAESDACVRLEPGQVVAVLRIRRAPLGDGDADPYLTEFESGGRIYTCPLYQFQARTESLALSRARRSLTPTVPA